MWPFSLLGLWSGTITMNALFFCNIARCAIFGDHAQLLGIISQKARNKVEKKRELVVFCLEKIQIQMAKRGTNK